PFSLTWTLRQNCIAMRTGPRLAEPLLQLGLERRRHSVLQSFRLLVNLVPLHPENLAEHSFNEVMTQCSPVGGLTSSRGQWNNPGIAHLDQAVALESLERHRASRSRYLKPMRQGSGNHLVTLRLCLKDGFQVVLF